MQLNDVLIRQNWKPSGTVSLTHYSRNKELVTVSPDYYGTGHNQKACQERERIVMPYWLDRTFWGLEVGEPGGYVREPMLGGIAYEAFLDSSHLYDYREDPLNLLESSESINHYEWQIKEAGFFGYWLNHPSLGLVAVLFVPLPVRRKED